MTSASGGSRAALEKPNRVVITATKSGNEKNATVFARFWVEALRDPSADTDKNETVSALEAFTYAETKTAQFYDTQKRLATEHPILEDTGQGDGERKPSPENGEGLKAAQFALLRIGTARADGQHAREESAAGQARRAGRADRQAEVRKGCHVRRRTTRSSSRRC